MKKILCIALSLVMAFSMIACAAKQEAPAPAAEEPAKTEAPKAEEPKAEEPKAEEPAPEPSWDSEVKNWTLKIASINASVVTEMLALSAQSFKEQYPEFNIEVTELENLAGNMPSIALSNEYDMMWVQRVDQWQTLANEGYFLDISDLYQDGGWLDSMGEDVCAIYLNDKGQYCGVCDDMVWVCCMWYNPEIFEKLNLEVPKTWQDVHEISPVLKENGITPIAIDGLLHAFYSVVSRMLDPEDYNKLCDPLTAPEIWTSEEMRAVFEEYKYLCENSFDSSAILGGGAGNDGAATMFANGECAMVLGMSSTEASLLSALPEDFEYKFMITPDWGDRLSGVPVFNGNSMNIFASTEEPELAKAFLAHHLSQQAQSALAESGILWPARSDISGDVLAKQSEGIQKSVEAMGTRGTMPLVETLMGGTWRAVFGPALANYLTGQYTFEQASTEIAESIAPQG